MRDIFKGSTDQSTVVRIVDAADGTPEIAVNNSTAGLQLSYRRETANVVNFNAINLASGAAAHVDGGLIHLFAGYYRVDQPDAAQATGADGVLVGGNINNMVVIASYHPLVDFAMSGNSAIKLKRGADALVIGETNANGNQTNISTNLTENTNNHYSGAVIAFVGGTLDGQRDRVVSYTTGNVVVTGLTDIPANNQQFVIS